MFAQSVLARLQSMKGKTIEDVVAFGTKDRIMGMVLKFTDGSQQKFDADGEYCGYLVFTVYPEGDVEIPHIYEKL